MEHVLDSPAWNALISGNKNLSNGNGDVKYFDKEVSPFFGLKENSTDNFKILHKLLPHNGPLLFVTPTEMELPPFWKVLDCIKGVQMICDKEVEQTEFDSQLVQLTDEHVAQMLTLTKLTNPGPFAQRTIDFGHFYGIFDEGKLVAMAGQRLHVFDYMEVSGVCTHPDYIGRGYARQLLLNQIDRIKTASGVPFLHVRHDNDRAIKVYESLGFSARRKIYFYVLLKK